MRKQSTNVRPCVKPLEDGTINVGAFELQSSLTPNPGRFLAILFTADWDPDYFCAERLDAMLRHP